jgi:hypothetical protein
MLSTLFDVDPIESFDVKSSTATGVNTDISGILSGD